MRTYESMVILDPDIDPKDTKKRDAVIKKLFGNFADAIVSITEFGKRELRYEINKKKEGLYILVNLKTDKQINTGNIQKQSRMMTEVLRFLVTSGGVTV